MPVAVDVMPNTTNNTSALDDIVEQQLVSLDDTDAYASVWSDLLASSSSTQIPQWGGRGRGGRGLARRTFQPRDILVENVRLEYVSVNVTTKENNNNKNDSKKSKQVVLPSNLLLENATLKLLAGHVYALVGRNGVGKSTLLRRIHAGKIPGFPPHIATLYIPQELRLPALPNNDKLSVMDMLQQEFVSFSKATSTSLQYQMELMEQELDALHDDNGNGNDNNANKEEKMEALCEELSNLQDAMDQVQQEDQLVTTTFREQLQEALLFFGIPIDLHEKDFTSLSPGQRKKVSLAVAYLCASTVSSSQQFLLCLDEPTSHLDVPGLIQLRRFLQDTEEAHNRTILMVSHDTDLLNDTATDIITFSHIHKTLSYYPGNYWDYQRNIARQELHLLRQQVSLDKKRQHMVQTIHHLQAQPAPKRGGNRKKAKQISAQRKKLERQGLERDAKGHRWTQQAAGTGIKPGAINGIDASTRKDLSTAELLQLAEASIRPPPDKAVQFLFRSSGCTWGEPLIMAMDVGHGYGVVSSNTTTTAAAAAPKSSSPYAITRRDGYLFDCVDLCINEGHTYCLLGASNSGKSVLLRVLAKREEPLEGVIQHAQNVQVGYFGQETMDELLTDASYTNQTALAYLSSRFPSKTDKEIRGELTNFGLNPAQASTSVRFMSGGERCRLCLAALMLENPHVLCLDNPTTNLDVESVEALIYGLQRWKNGTIVMVSHDANLIRSLEAECAVLIEDGGKLRRVEGGIDNYLRSFKY